MITLALGKSLYAAAQGLLGNTWTRRLSKREMDVVASWQRLDRGMPKNGDECEWMLIGKESTSEGRAFWYQTSTLPGRFCDPERGSLCADHRYIYWRPVAPPP